MNLNLPNEINDFVKGLVSQGRFDSEEYAVIEGIRLLMSRDNGFQRSGRSAASLQSIQKSAMTVLSWVRTFDRRASAITSSSFGVTKDSWTSCESFAATVIRNRSRGGQRNARRSPLWDRWPKLLTLHMLTFTNRSRVEAAMSEPERRHTAAVRCWRGQAIARLPMIPARSNATAIGSGTGT